MKRSIINTSSESSEDDIPRISKCSRRSPMSKTVSLQKSTEMIAVAQKSAVICVLNLFRSNSRYDIAQAKILFQQCAYGLHINLIGECIEDIMKMKLDSDDRCNRVVFLAQFVK